MTPLTLVTNYVGLLVGEGGVVLIYGRSFTALYEYNIYKKK